MKKYWRNFRTSAARVAEIFADSFQTAFRKTVQMAQNGTKTKKYRQRVFMRALLQGYTIVSASRIAGISERCAFYWLKEPDFAAARKQYEQELARLDFEEVKRLSVESIQQSWNERFKR